LLPLLTSGCVTHKLWSESKMDEWNEPAGDPNLRLFRAAKQGDFLVVYDEYSDRHCTTQPRAFFLLQNQKLLAQNHRPHFVSTNAACKLSPVPVFCPAPTQVSNSLYAVTASNGGHFTIISGNHELGSYALPAYDDGVGRMERIAWTPLTVTADLTIVGGVAVIVVWACLAGSNASISGP
jgi:hypothetical protein